MKIKYTFIALVVINLSVVCTTKEHFNLNDFIKIKNKNECLIYIIPNSGCTGCINDIENLAKNNLNSDSLVFVFTKINSLKAFKNKFGQELINSNNIVIDTNNNFIYENKLLDIYPVLYNKKSSNNVNFVKYFKPQ